MKKLWKQVRVQKLWKRIREWKHVEHTAQGLLYLEQISKAFAIPILTARLEPIMLTNLPIIPSRSSQNFYVFLFYSHSNTNYSFLFYCISDNIAM